MKKKIIKTSILLLLMTIVISSCKKTINNAPSNSKNEVSVKKDIIDASQKQQYIAVLKEYKNVNLVDLKKFMDLNKIKDKQTIADNLTSVAVTVDQANKLIDENNFKELVLLLDSTKGQFYTHPSSITLYKSFNELLDSLYLQTLESDLALEKIINNHEWRMISIKDVIFAKGDEYKDNKSFYDNTYKGELNLLRELYTKKGNSQTEIDEINRTLKSLE